jgi:WD40 repeat protein
MIRPYHLASLSAFFFLLLAATQSPRLVEAQTKAATPAVSVRCVAFSPDGRLLAACSGDPSKQGKVVVWDTSDTSKVLFTNSAAAGLRSIAFSPDSKFLAAVGYSGDCQLIDAATGKLKAVLGEHGEACRSVTFSVDNKTLAIASDNGSVYLRDYLTGSKLVTLSEHVKPVSSVQFSSSGKTLVSCGEDGSQCLWETESGKLQHKWQAQFGLSPFAAFEPSGKFVLIASMNDALIVIRDLEGGKPRVMHAANNPYWFALHPQAKVIATATRKAGGVTVMPLDLREATPAEAKTIEDHIAAWQSDSYEVREDASRELIKLGWIADPILAAAFKNSPMAETRVRARAAREAIRSPAERATILHGHQDNVFWAAFSPDGNTLASSGRDGLVILWDWATGKMKAKLIFR